MDLMCRNIRTLYNFDPPATDDEIRAAALQFVRKLSGFTKPSQANEAAFNQAIDDTADAARRLLGSLTTTTGPRDRGEWTARLKARAAERYGRPAAVSSSSTPSSTPPSRPAAGSRTVK
jgi:hypothetical protein